MPGDDAFIARAWSSNPRVVRQSVSTITDTISILSHAAIPCWRLSDNPSGSLLFAPPVPRNSRSGECVWSLARVLLG